MGIGRPARKQGSGPIGKGALDRILTGIERLHLAQQTDRFKIIDRTSLGLVTTTNRIPRQTQHIANSEGMGPKQIGLKGQAVAIAASQLQHRLNANIQ